MAQAFIQLLLVNGLAQMGIHARRLNGLAVFGAGLGRQCNYGQMRQRRCLANGTRGLHAIHIGHVHVHQHHVKGLAFENLQRVQAVGSQFHLHAHQIEKIGGHFAVQRVVVHHQHAPAFELRVVECR